MKKSTRPHHGTLTELNITPLLDLVFVLLVIFIITTPQLVNHLEMTLPSSQPPPKPNPEAPKPKITRIEVTPSGQALLDGQPLTLPELRLALERLKAQVPDPAVVVKGSDETDYQNMVNVLDVLQQLDITKVGLATDSASR